MTSAVTCEARQLVAGVLTTPYDVTFKDVIKSRCPVSADGDELLMRNGLSVDVVKCTVYGRQGRLHLPQSQCHLSTYISSTHYNVVYTLSFARCLFFDDSQDRVSVSDGPFTLT